MNKSKLLYPMQGNYNNVFKENISSDSNHKCKDSFYFGLVVEHGRKKFASTSLGHMHSYKIISKLSIKKIALQDIFLLKLYQKHFPNLFHNSFIKCYACVKTLKHGKII